MNKNYLTFTLNDSIYAVPVLQVREVLDYQEPQELPCPDPVVAGLIRSRGQSISVINLRQKFGFETAEPTRDTRIVVVEIDSISENSNTEGQIVFGMIVDAVDEVVELDSSRKEPPPEVGNSIAAEFISGIGELDKRFVIILNIDKALSFEEINPIIAAAEEEETASEVDAESDDFDFQETEAATEEAEEGQDSLDQEVVAEDTESEDEKPSLEEEC